MKENTWSRFQFGDTHVENAMSDLKQGLERRLQEKGWGISVSRHEIYGLLVEEFDELLKALRQHGPEARRQFREELLDIGVGVILGLCSIDTHQMDW